MCQFWQQPAFSGFAVALTSEVAIVLFMAGSGVTSCGWLNLRSSFMRTRRVVSRTVAHVVSRRPLTLEARVRSQASPCRICGRQVVLGQVFLRVRPSLSRLHIHASITSALQS